MVAVAHIIARLVLSLENSIGMVANAGVKLLARIVPLFIQLRQNGIISICQAAVAPGVAFALLLFFVIPSYAAVYTVNYAARAAAALVVTMPLVVLGLFFRRVVASALTAGIVEA